MSRRGPAVVRVSARPLAELGKVERAISPALEQVYAQLVSLRLVDPRED